ncbi:MAG: GNAT superfamily N-acetyltransferase [Paraglaciecola psychrophila]|jgi:GNAT superfamily N-acetyltransferase
MAITATLLCAEDRLEWEQLYRGYAGFYQVPMTPQILDNVWSWIFDDSCQFYALVAKDDSERSVGLMHYRAMASPLRGSMVGFLDDLFVDPSSRGQGVVDVLFTALEQSARDHDWPIVRWLTADNNYRGRAVYDKLAERTSWITYQMPVD